MAELIQGLHVDVTATELQCLLEGRLKYHQDKITAYSAQLVQLNKVDAALAEDAEMISKTSGTSPKSSLDQAIKKHRDQSVYYAFMAKHVVSGATYRLNEQDLTRLGIQSERYY